ncbi:MAG: sigma-54-dependent transcriptional regulator [Candidatus Sumerlaeia bacterium]
MAHTILLIEDDLAFSKRLKANLQNAGYEVHAAPDGEKAFELLASEWFDLVVTDIRLPDINGLEIMEQIKKGQKGLDSDLPIMVLTSVRDVETAVDAMRKGAADYLTKESERKEILMRIERVLDQTEILSENRYLRDQLERQTEFQEMIGESRAIREIKDEIRNLAGQDVSVLITGETGVGKELVARALHRTGAHPQGPFVDVNCGALPDENLLLSELFGHERGAFTGAVRLKKGRFEQARGGTLFLDEIAEMPLGAQARILKTLESMRISRLGGSSEIETRCRLIFASNKPLEKEVEAGRFRQDLFYRVNLLPLHIPPLRQRIEDIPLLARFFIDQFCRHYRKAPRVLPEGALIQLQNHDWPGNVRELRNVMERLVIRSREEKISLEDLSRCGLGDNGPRSGLAMQIPESGISLDEMEKQLVIQALEKADWNQKEAAKLLDISVDRMNARVKKYGLTHPAWRVHR